MEARWSKAALKLAVASGLVLEDTNVIPGAVNDAEMDNMLIPRRRKRKKKKISSEIEENPIPEGETKLMQEIEMCEKPGGSMLEEEEALPEPIPSTSPASIQQKQTKREPKVTSNNSWPKSEKRYNHKTPKLSIVYLGKMGSKSIRNEQKTPKKPQRYWMKENISITRSNYPTKKTLRRVLQGVSLKSWRWHKFKKKP